MCCSERKAARRAQALASQQAFPGAPQQTTPLLMAEAPTQESNTLSMQGSPPSYTVAMAKQSAGPYDLAPIASTPAGGVRSFDSIVDDDGFAMGAYTPAQLACSHTSLRRRFGTIGVLGGIAFFPWGLFWTFCDSRYECKQCHANLGKNGDGRWDTCAGGSCGRANRATLGMPRSRCGGRPQCGYCGRRRCRRGCAGYAATF